MPQVSRADLRDAASAAHVSGDGETAIRLFRQIIVRFPHTAEAGEAVFYLASIGEGPRPSDARAMPKKKGPP